MANIFQKMFGGALRVKNLVSGRRGRVFDLPGYTDRGYTFKQITQEGYMKNPIVNRVVSEVAEGAAGVPFILQRNGKDVDNHPILKLLNRPNAMQGRIEFFTLAYTTLELGGEVFILNLGVKPEVASTTTRATPTHLRILESSMMDIEYDSATGMPSAYVYQRPGKQKIRYRVNESGESAVLHIKHVNPLDPNGRGLSKFCAAAYAIDTYNETNKFQLALLNNSGKPAGVLVIGDENTELNAEDQDRLEHGFDAKYGGAENAGKTAILKSGVDFKKMGFSPDEMDFTGSLDSAARAIALVGGVPAQLIGIKESQTYNNMAEAALALYQNKVVPLAEMFLGELSNWLFGQYGVAASRGLEIKYNWKEVPAMAELERRMIENAIKLSEANLLSPDQALERIDYPPMPNGYGSLALVKGKELISEVSISTPVPGENDNAGTS